MNCAAVILAAGASSRMGRPKALLAIEGETFVDRLIGVFQACGAEVIVVLGHHADAIRDGMKRSALVAINPDPDRGQLSSLQCGLSLLPPETEAFFFLPVDCPAVRAETLHALLAAMRDHPGALLAIPRFEGRRGHPAACRASLAAEFLALPPTAQARQTVHGHAGQTIYADTDDPGVLLDIDDPQAYARFAGAASTV